MKKKNKSIAIIDSIECHNYAKKYSPDYFITDNILLYDQLVQCLKNKIICTDDTITQKDINKWGKMFINWSLVIDRELNALAAKHKLKGSIQEAPKTFMYFLALFCRVKGLLRKISLKDIKKVIIVYSDNNKWYNTNKHYRFISPYPLLAKNGFFGTAQVIVKKINVKFISELNVSHSKSFFLRFLSANILENFIWYVIKNRYFKFKKASIIVKGQSEIIKENVFSLFLRGYIPITYDNIIKQYKKNINKKSLDLFELNNKISNYLKESLRNNFYLFNYQIDALSNLVIQSIKKNLGSSLYSSYETDFFFRSINKKYKNIKSIITSSPVGTDAKYFYEAAKKNKIKVINFEHGLTVGLAMRNKYYMEFSEATNCDHMFVVNELAKKDYKANKTSKIAKIYISGIANQCKKIYYKSFQKNYLRRKFGFKKQDFCICHVSTLLFNSGIRYGPHTLTDKQVNKFNNEILTQVYNKLENKKIVFKDYPSLRHIYQPKIEKRINVNNKNIFFQEDGDWRYLRAIADLIVTMVPTSTLSWCLGSNVPIVWINIPEARFRYKWLYDSFKNSFFYFDVNDISWKTKLKRFLSLPKEEIYKKWIDKEVHRNHLIDNHLFDIKNNIQSFKKIKQLML